MTAISAAPMPTTDSTTATSLYARILGDDWLRVAEGVRAAHFAGRTIERRGTFQVRRGAGLLVRALAVLLRLPAAGEGIPIRLRIEGDGAGERWIRHFGDQRLTTRQRTVGELLGERFGPLEILFRLEVVDGALTYRTVGARLTLGRLAAALPRGLRPAVEARESVDESAEGAGGEGSRATHVVVEVRVPWLGRLIRYEGRLDA
jgi:hypothetical protein